MTALQEKLTRAAFALSKDHAISLGAAKECVLTGAKIALQDRNEEAARNHFHSGEVHPTVMAALAPFFPEPKQNS